MHIHPQRSQQSLLRLLSPEFMKILYGDTWQDRWEVLWELGNEEEQGLPCV